MTLRAIYLVCACNGAYLRRPRHRHSASVQASAVPFTCNVLSIVNAIDRSLVCSLGKLVNKVAEPRSEEMCRQLCNTILTGKKAEQRDIASIGLKTIIAEVSVQAVAAKIATNITANMLQGTANQVRHHSDRRQCPQPCCISSQAPTMYHAAPHSTTQHRSTMHSSPVPIRHAPLLSDHGPPSTTNYCQVVPRVK
jgi:hypothetical protein